MGILRFILAITVVIAHSSSVFGCNFVGAQIAVQAFYIISGFYMALILNEKYVGVNGSYKLFISNRFLRLYPIYWTVLLLTIAMSIAVTIHSNGSSIGQFTVYSKYFNVMSLGSFVFLIFTNLFLFLQDIVMFLGLNTTTGHLYYTSDFSQTKPQLHHFLLIPQAWTIGVEIAFYLIAPFLVRQKFKYIIFFIVMSLLLRFVLSNYGLSNDPWSYRFFPTELVFFMLGIVSYQLYVKIRSLDINKVYLKTIWMFLLGITLFYDFMPLPYKYPVYLFLFFIGLPFVFILTKKWKYDTYIGELSYPIYISHIFVMSCLYAFKIPIVLGLGFSLIIATILFSVLLNEVVTKKIEIFRQKRVKLISNNKDQ